MKKILLLPLLILIIIFFSKYIYDAGFFKQIGNKKYHSKYNCQKIGKMQGPEDLSLVETHLFISSGYHKPFFSNKSLQGDVYYKNLEFAEDKLFKLSMPNDFYFNPHGIDATKIGDDKIMILAINHRADWDSIEKFIFSISEKKMSHVQTIGLGEKLKLLNDVAIVSEKKFFVSQESKLKNSNLRNLFKYLRMGTGRVLLFDQGQKLNVFDGFFYTNGLVFDRLNSQLFVAEMLGLRINQFKFADDKLDIIEQYNLDGGPDNMHLDSSNGELYVALHPKLFELKHFSENVDNSIAPSQLDVIDLNKKNIKTVLLTLEPGWSAKSIFLPYKNKLLIGNIYNQGIDLCDNPHQINP